LIKDEDKKFVYLFIFNQSLIFIVITGKWERVFYKYFS